MLLIDDIALLLDETEVSGETSPIFRSTDLLHSSTLFFRDLYRMTRFGAAQYGVLQYDAIVEVGLSSAVRVSPSVPSYIPHGSPRPRRVLGVVVRRGAFTVLSSDAPRFSFSGNCGHPSVPYRGKRMLLQRHLRPLAPKPKFEIFRSATTMRSNMPVPHLQHPQETSKSELRI